jgi:hypothetical protein
VAPVGHHMWLIGPVRGFLARAAGTPANLPVHMFVGGAGLCRGTAPELWSARHFAYLPVLLGHCTCLIAIEASRVGRCVQGK